MTLITLPWHCPYCRTTDEDLPGFNPPICWLCWRPMVPTHSCDLETDA